MIKFVAKAKTGWLINSAIEPMMFPGGEVHLKTPPAVDNEIPYLAFVTGANLNDYMALIEWADFVHSKGFKAVAVIPYLPAARADRGHPFGAKAYADMIETAKLDQIICFDPHSHAMPEMLSNLVTVHSDTLIKKVLNREKADTNKFVGVIAPDQGAHERTERVAAALNLPVFYAKKHRDPDTGKLSGFSCDPLPEEGRLLVVDDICDGGGTFLGLAAVTGVERERLALWVSHGIFSGKANELNQAFGKIYTTDSHPGSDREDVNAQITAILPHLMEYITVKN